MKRHAFALLLAAAATLTASASPAPLTFVALPDGPQLVYDSRQVSITVTREGRYTWVTFERAVFVHDFESGD